MTPPCKSFARSAPTSPNDASLMAPGNARQAGRQAPATGAGCWGQTGRATGSGRGGQYHRPRSPSGPSHSPESFTKPHVPQDGRLPSLTRVVPAASPREHPLRNGLSRKGYGRVGRSHITRSVTPHDNTRVGAEPRNLLVIHASRVRITKICDYRSRQLRETRTMAAGGPAGGFPDKGRI